MKLTIKADFSADEIKIRDFDKIEAFRLARRIEQDGMYCCSRIKDEGRNRQVASPRRVARWETMDSPVKP